MILAGRLKNALVKFEPICVQKIKDAQMFILAVLQKYTFSTEMEALQTLRDKDVTDTAKQRNAILFWAYDL